MSEEIKELLFLLHNDRLTEAGKRKLEQEIERLDNIIDKAIEKLERYNDNESNYYVPVDIVIEILKGSDKE